MGNFEQPPMPGVGPTPKRGPLAPRPDRIMPVQESEETQQAQQEIWKIVDSLMSAGNQKNLKELAAMEKSPERAARMGALIQTAKDRLKGQFGLETHPQKELPGYPPKELDDFMKRYPDYLIEKVLEEKLNIILNADNTYFAKGN